MTVIDIPSLPEWIPPLPAGASPDRPSIFIVGPNGGGTRKTRTTVDLASVAKAGGHRVLFVDADSGISSLGNSLAVGVGYNVVYAPHKETGNFAATLLDMARECGSTMMIVDLGANQMLQPESLRTLEEAFKQLRDMGCRMHVILSLTATKGGLYGDALNFGDKMRKYGSVIPFYHGRAVGGDFRQIDRLKAEFPKTVEVTSHEVAVADLMMARKILPFDFARAPGDGFAMAGAFVAQALKSLADQPVVQEMLGCDGGSSELGKLAAAAPRYRYNLHTKLWEVCDELLAADSDLIAADDALDRLSVDSPNDALLAAARGLLSAKARRRDVWSVARKRYSNPAPSALRVG